MSTKYAKARNEAAQLKASQRQMRDRMRDIQMQRNELFDALCDLLNDLDAKDIATCGGTDGSYLRAKRAISSVSEYEPPSDRK